MDGRDASGFWRPDSKQQRVRERERRERQKQERLERERLEREDDELRAQLTKRLTEGDLRPRVIERVVAQLKSAEVEAVEKATAERRATLLAQIDDERKAAIAKERSKEERRLSEERRLVDIVKENERAVAEEARRRVDKDRRSQRERQEELARFSLEHKRRIEAAVSDPSASGAR